MTIIERFEFWGDHHHPKWVDIIRIALGIFLCYKGIEFSLNMSLITGPLSNKTSFGSFAVILLAHYVVFAHITGGLLIAIGLYTRVACILQIPILLGAVIFINSASDVFRPYSEMILSVIALTLLVYFLIIGGGPWSVKIKEDERSKQVL